MKTIFLALATVASFAATRACDLCSGGVSNLNPYLFPHLSKNYVALSYQHNAFFINSGATAKQWNNSVALTGQYTLRNRLQLLAVVPFQLNTITSPLASLTSAGAGDASLTATYLAMRTTAGATTHALSAGAGVKLPTGRYKSAKTPEAVDQNFQLGTGSTDCLLNLGYRAGIGQLAVSAVATYRYTTANKEGYRFGDMLTAGATVAWIVKTSALSLSPYGQLLHETRYRDAFRHVLQNHSGGHVLFAGGGLDVSAKKFAVGLNYQVPTGQSLLQGALTARPRFATRLSFTL